MKQIVATFACCVLAAVSTGCSQNQSLVRGQTPVEYQSTPAYGPVSYSGPAGGYSDGFDCPACPQGSRTDWWRPTHHHTWEYHAPQDLLYPPENQQPAVLQYPYYTVKGPSDFFLK